MRRYINDDTSTLARIEPSQKKKIVTSSEWIFYLPEQIRINLN